MGFDGFFNHGPVIVESHSTDIRCFCKSLIYDHLPYLPDIHAMALFPGCIVVRNISFLTVKINSNK